MEFFEKIRIALDSSDPQFQEATQYFVELKNENPTGLLQGFMEVLECDEVSQEYKNKVIPIMTSFMSKRNNFFLSVNKYKGADMEIIQHAETLLLQYFQIPDEKVAKQASQVFAILRRIPRNCPLGKPEKIGDLVEILSNGELEHTHLTSVTRAMKSILRNLYLPFSESEYELMDVILNYFSSYTIPDISKRHFLSIVSSIVGTFEFTDWPQENMVAILNLCWEYSLVWPKIAKNTWERLLSSHVDIINLVPDFTNLFLDAVNEDSSRYPLMKVLCMTLYSQTQSDSQQSSVVDLLGDRLEEGINLILRLISEYSKEDNGIYPMEYSDERCVPMMTTSLFELASRGSQDALAILWNFVTEYFESEDPQERYTASVAFRAVMTNMPYFPNNTEDSQLEEQAVKIGPATSALTLEIKDAASSLIDRMLSDDVPAIVVNGFSCMTIAAQNNILPVNDQTIEFLSTYTSSEDQNVRDSALSCLTSVLSQLPAESKSAVFAGLMQALEQTGDEEAASTILRSMQTAAFYLSQEAAAEYLQPALELTASALAEGASIYTGPAVGLLSDLFKRAGEAAAESASTVMEMVGQLLGTDYDEDGLNLLNAFLTAFGDREADVLQSASEVALERLETPPNEQILQTVLKTAELIVPFLTDDELLQKMLSLTVPFTEDAYVQNKCRMQLMALIVTIGAQSEAVVTANMDLFINLNDRLRVFHYYSARVVPCLMHILPGIEDGTGTHSVSMWFSSALNYLRAAQTEEDAHLFVVILEQYRAKCPSMGWNSMGFYFFSEANREKITKLLSPEDVATLNELIPPPPPPEPQFEE